MFPQASMLRRRTVIDFDHNEKMNGDYMRMRLEENLQCTPLIVDAPFRMETRNAMGIGGALVLAGFEYNLTEIEGSAKRKAGALFRYHIWDPENPPDDIDQFIKDEPTIRK